MKKFFLILLVAIVANAYGQSDFPLSNAIWNVDKVNAHGPYEHTLYATIGDTLINDTAYSILSIINDTVIGDEMPDTHLVGYIRNEGEKVLLRCDGGEITLYDFSKTVGDTIWHNGYFVSFFQNETHYGLDEEHFKYISIINNRYVEDGLEKYEVSIGYYDDEYGFYELYGDVWIRGVGSERGLIRHLWYPPMSEMDRYYDNTLKCLKHNGIVKYFNDPQCSKCFCWYDTSEISNETADNSISIYPNPACNSISIKVEKEYTDLKIEIMDEMGKLVYSNNEIDNPISLDGFATGIYFVQLNIDGKVTTKKIVVE